MMLATAARAASAIARRGAVAARLPAPLRGVGALAARRLLSSTPSPPPAPQSSWAAPRAGAEATAPPAAGDEAAGAPAGTNSDADAATDTTFAIEPSLVDSTPRVSDASRKTVLAAVSGNAAITVLKAVVWWRSGSASMLAEAIHSAIDTANQALLALGLRQSALRPDTQHSFGYGRAAFIWGLISALGMFWVGGGVSIAHGIESLLAGDHDVSISWENWAVLGLSFVVDGSVLAMAAREIMARTAAEAGAEGWSRAGLLSRARAVWGHVRGSSDPFLVAVFLEDLCACTGVLLAAAGVGLAQWTGMAAFDAGASVAIGGMLAAVATTLVRLNMRYLMGQSIQPARAQEISALIRSFPSIDGVRYINTQYLSPTTFLLSAKVDFDGTFLAAKLHREYEDLFLKSANLHDDLPLILSCFAEDVTRTVEEELKAIEAAIRSQFPGAALIELEPDSKESHLSFARSIMLEGPRARAEEVAEVLEHHLTVLAAAKKAKPDDTRIDEMARRITEWHRRRTALLARSPPAPPVGGNPHTSATQFGLPPAFSAAPIISHASGTSTMMIQAAAASGAGGEGEAAGAAAGQAQSGPRRH